MKNFNIFGVHGKIPVLGGAYEKPICRGGLPEKEGAWTVFRFKAGLARKREVVFLRGGRRLIPQCTLWLPMIQ